MQAFLSDFVISLASTLVVSRVQLWITKGWTNSIVRLVVVHAASLVLCVALGTWVLAGAADSPSLGALALFAPAQLAWLLVDLLRRVLRQRQAGK
jgi:hypothetical protein